MPEIPKTIVDPEIIRNPFPTLGLLREHAPVYHDETIGVYFVTRYEDVKALFAEEELLSRDRRQSPGFTPPPPGSWAERMDENGTGRATGEEHRAWRARGRGSRPRSASDRLRTRRSSKSAGASRPARRRSPGRARKSVVWSTPFQLGPGASV